MSMVAEQMAFAKDISTLILYVFEQPGWGVTLGEAYRTVEQQKLHVQAGRSLTMNSQHIKRLAEDLMFFKDGKLIWEKELIKPFGEKWKSLSPGKNRWGGDFTRLVDVPHFERIG
jgi:peptidoglycan L-alanyl-D-glutamate endopeptidase CwlK